MSRSPQVGIVRFINLCRKLCRKLCRFPVGRDSVEPNLERSEASAASIPGSQGSTESRPTDAAYQLLLRSSRQQSPKAVQTLDKVSGKVFKSSFSGQTLVLLSLALSLVAPTLPAQTAREYQLKAVLLFNFTRFVEWPPDALSPPNAPFVIGIVGNDPFGRTLDDLAAGETVAGHPVIVERYRSADALKPCHILFISRSESPSVQTILARLRGTSTLTISELEGFTALTGGMIRMLTNEEGKIRLRINNDAASVERLKVSSKLLRVAEVH